MPKNWIINITLIISLIGVLDAGYLAFNHLQGGDIGCFLVHGCDIVLNSKYAAVFGIPISALGFLYYSTVFTGVFAYNLNRNSLLLKRISQLTIVGLIVSTWLLYLQIFIIEEFCSYCLISAITSGTLFVMGMYTLWTLKKKDDIIPL
jgi:uncharacterized membrane protein